MKKTTIAVIDSGIGGLSVLKDMFDRFSGVDFIYYSDTKNLPFGNKPVRELIKIAFDALFLVSSYDIDCAVLACNTLSITALNKVKSLFDFPIYGVFPPVERAVMDGNAILLSTVRTAEYYNGVKNLSVIGLPNLASDIEYNAFTCEKINVDKHLNIIKPYSGRPHTVILGCTHYFFVKNGIGDHLKPLRILSGSKFTCHYISKNFFKLKTLVKHKRNRVKFIGKNKKFNKKVWLKVVFKV